MLFSIMSTLPSFHWIFALRMPSEVIVKRPSGSGVTGCPLNVHLISAAPEALYTLSGILVPFAKLPLLTDLLRKMYGQLTGDCLVVMNDVLLLSPLSSPISKCTLIV